MYPINQLDELGREQLYMVINRLKRQIYSMNSDFMRFEVELKKYFNHFRRFNQTIEICKELRDVIEEIEIVNKMNETRCGVSLEELAKSEQTKSSTDCELISAFVAINSITNQLFS